MITSSRFNGADYKHERDSARLTNQHADIFNLMADGKFRTLGQIATLTNHPESSVSAQLRHMRKPRFGSHEVNRRHVLNGLYEYQLIVNFSAKSNTGEMVGMVDDKHAQKACLCANEHKVTDQ